MRWQSGCDGRSEGGWGGVGGWGRVLNQAAPLGQYVMKRGGEDPKEDGAKYRNEVRVWEGAVGMGTWHSAPPALCTLPVCHVMHSCCYVLEPLSIRPRMRPALQSLHLFFWGGVQTKMSWRSLLTVLEITSRNQGSELSSATMIPQLLW